MVGVQLLASVNILGGLVFGYNAGVFAVTLTLVANWVYMSSYIQGLFASSILIGAMIGSLFGGIYCDYFGRKVSLITVGGLGALGAIATAVAPTLATMMVARGILGLGVGLSTVACPTYVSENAPESQKGTLGTLFQLAITFGICVAYIVALPFANVPSAFRYMYGIGAVPGVMLFLLGFLMPESAYYISLKIQEYDPLIKRRSGAPPSQEKGQIKELLFGSASKPFYIGMLLAVAQQLTGINAFMSYGPDIFKSAGIEEPVVATIGIGVWNFLTTIVSTLLVDRLGRRPLLVIGTAGMAISTVGLALVFHFVSGSALGYLSITLLFVFIAGFELGEGPLFWVVCAELFPPEFKGTALSLLNASVWIFNLMLQFGFLPVKDAIGQEGVFWVFGAFGTVCVVLMYFVLPETKNNNDTHNLSNFSE